MRIIRKEKLEDGRLYVAAEPEGVCSQAVELLINDGVVEQARFHGGCGGNTQGICRLIAGMTIAEVVRRLQGIDCGGKGTSCPDQLSQVLASLSPDEQQSTLA